MELNDIKKRYSYVGFVYFLLTVLTFILQRLAGLLASNQGWVMKDWTLYLVRMIPMWGIAFPICYLLLKRIPAERPWEENIGIGRVLLVYPKMLVFIIGGSLIGTVLSFIIGLLFNGEVKNATINLIQDQKILPSFVFAVIVAPVMEELCFRKVLIDRLSMYSKKYTIILSGVMFGLFHANLYQFFYACFLGIAFAYVYTKTGKIWYTMMLHAMVNCIHGIIPMFFMGDINLQEFQNLSNLDPNDPATVQRLMGVYTNPGFLMLMGWAFLIFAIMIVGIILFIIDFKKIHVDDTNSPLQKPYAVKTIYLNAGMILFIIGLLAESSYALIGQILSSGA